MSFNPTFRKAERSKAKLRCGLAGPSGSGKTYSALLMAFGLGGRVAMIDTENGSGDLYAHLGEYDICPITSPFTPDKYVAAIKQAEAAGYDVVIIDSLSHAWAGEGGLLDMQGKIADSGKGNSYTAWRSVTPKHNALVEAMLQSKAHVIATMRSKQDYVQQRDEKTGKAEIKKVGMAPIQREGMEYEFTIMFDLTMDHTAIPSKDRTSIFDGGLLKPSPEMGKTLLEWLNAGKDVPAPAPAAAPAPAQVAPPAAAPTAAPAAAEPPKPVNGLPGEDPAKATAPKQGEQPFPVDMVNDGQRKKLMASFNDLGIKNRDTRLSWVRSCLNAPGVSTVMDLTKDQASKVIDALEHALTAMREQKKSA
ncbi:MAG: ATP-binding protein [Deltaproteobacteria bacterium]|nr:ATP-binding protein [Deltaproteobacteria bacterium]